MNTEQFKAATQGTTEQRDAQMRQVSNGFALVGTRRFVEPDTGAARLTQTVEAVAADGPGVVAALTNFVNTGSFSAA